MSPRSPVSGRGCPVFQCREDVNGDEAKKSGPVVLVQFADGYSDQFSAKEAIAYMKAKGYGVEDIASINSIALDV